MVPEIPNKTPLVVYQGRLAFWWCLEDLIERNKPFKRAERKTTAEEISRLHGREIYSDISPNYGSQFREALRSTNKK